MPNIFITDKLSNKCLMCGAIYKPGLNNVHYDGAKLKNIST